VTPVPLGITVAVALAAGLDWTVREPPADAHPVALFGAVVDRLAAHPWAASKPAGAALAVALPTAVAAFVFLPLRATRPLPGVVVVLAGLVLWTSTSLRLLLDVADRAIDRSVTGPDAAREALPALVGRDAAELSPPLVRSAAVESLAENLSDGLCAPLLAFAVFALVSLPAAAAAAAFVKAVNTMDSMLGYPGDVGWGSARLDDAVMFVPARLTAALLGPAAGDPEAPWRARRDARVPASPNAGWPMGTLAAALDVRLEKPGAYVLNDVADPPTVADGEAAIAAVRRAGLAAWTGTTALGVVLWL
jgi:adenosylcobinamide-phosphate synthase